MLHHVQLPSCLGSSACVARTDAYRPEASALAAEQEARRRSAHHLIADSAPGRIVHWKTRFLQRINEILHSEEEGIPTLV